MESLLTRLLGIAGRAWFHSGLSGRDGLARSSEERLLDIVDDTT